MPLLPSPNRQTIILRLCCIALALVTIGSFLQPQPQVEVAQLEGLVPDGLTGDDKEKVAGLSESVAAWMGPLAPIAVSPFFGIACLCAISQYGDSLGLPLNAFVSDNPVLQSPAVLWTFVILTLVTSLPRLTKVSKPVGQAIDQLEAWSGIITIIIIRVASAAAPDPSTEVAAVAAVPMVQCGFFSMSADVLFSIAAIINIMVINTVKFFFEVSVWLMPFPFVDAMLEAANKSVCAALMAVYAYSPFWATVLNLLLFVVCLFVFRWVKRQVTYMRSILFDPVWAMVQKTYGVPTAKELTVFPQQEIGPFAAREKLQLIDRGDDWELLQKRLLLPSRSHSIPKSSSSLLVEPGLIVNKINVSSDGKSETLLFTRRFNDHLPELSELLGMSMTESPSNTPAVTDLAMDS